jgi:hypothetical protein
MDTIQDFIFEKWAGGRQKSTYEIMGEGSACDRMSRDILSRKIFHLLRSLLVHFLTHLWFSNDMMS